MPIVDVQAVVSNSAQLPENAATAIAEAMAVLFKAPPGRVWVRLGALPEAMYAENGPSPSALRLPVFVRVRHAELPATEALAVESASIARVLAACLGRNPENIHIEYAPPGRGRVAFGGKLVQ